MLKFYRARDRAGIGNLGCKLILFSLARPQGGQSIYMRA
ncbi:hypothetical protein IHE45_16G056100 [Dioscorea alata]|uniref:Uncharacterized protein n=1 Tax=Dioscorea alata TaxID=55571 RepID=A0ACB7UHR2_DIOAL|nr:hypothetical protein IHE45_16G056100 [Dioscorea alata]